MLRRLRDLTHRMAAAFRGRTTRRPRVQADLAPAVPAGVLRLVAVATAVGCTALAASDPLHWFLALVVAASMLLRRADAAAPLLAVGLGLSLLASPPDPFAPRLFVLLVGLHLVTELAATTGDLPWQAPVERAVLRRAVPRFLGVQLLAQPVALAAAWATERDASVAWLPLVAGVTLAALAWTVLARLQQRT